jgi:hypothetical protein
MRIVSRIENLVFGMVDEREYEAKYVLKYFLSAILQ